jgi:hypothetical protein
MVHPGPEKEETPSLAKIRLVDYASAEHLGISLYRIVPHFCVRVSGRAGGLEAILVFAKTHDKAWRAFSQALRSGDVGGPADRWPPIQMGDQRM